jgi:hypothetical protein
MRQLVIDELSPMERDNIDSYLKRTLKPGPVIGLYWLPLPPDLLSPIQHEHRQCSPFHIGIEMERDQVRFEFLVRSTGKLHCPCTAYATPRQRQFIIDFIDRMLEEEHIRA